MKNLLKQKRNFFLLCWPAGLLFYVLTSNSGWIAEYIFARGIYVVYGHLLSFISGLFPFSLGEILFIFFCVGMAAFPIQAVIWVVRSKEKLVAVVSAIRLLLMVLGMVFLWYVIGAGANYFRYEFSELSGLEIKQSTVEELEALYEELIIKTNEARAELTDDEAPFVSSMTNRERAEKCREAMWKLSEEYEVLKGYYPYAKPVLFSRILSKFDITGVYFPWTVESNVNVDVPDFSKASTTCHELSHLRGFMREDEANYIGYLACIGSDSPELRYSGYMMALVYTGNQMYSADKDRYLELRSLYSAGVSSDLAANSQYWKQFENTRLSSVGDKMNNTYLKINRITDGTKSYGRMVDLLLAERRERENIQNSLE